MRDIGKNIRDLRIQKGLTQEQLAEQLFVTRQTVSNYENGKSRPDVEMIQKIAEVLACDVNT
ncbi:MAG: helix-turn-helix transcriptional regulator, partial [Clostridia bacterium]|nr:helix-turn-helix transcriptional regulator [Clostridia bacterium]